MKNVECHMNLFIRSFIAGILCCLPAPVQSDATDYSATSSDIPEPLAALVRDISALSNYEDIGKIMDISLTQESEPVRAENRYITYGFKDPQAAFEAHFTSDLSVKNRFTLTLGRNLGSCIPLHQLADEVKQTGWSTPEVVYSRGTHGFVVWRGGLRLEVTALFGRDFENMPPPNVQDGHPEDFANFPGCFKYLIIESQ